MTTASSFRLAADPPPASTCIHPYTICGRRRRWPRAAAAAALVECSGKWIRLQLSATYILGVQENRGGLIWLVWSVNIDISFILDIDQVQAKIHRSERLLSKIQASLALASPCDDQEMITNEESASMGPRPAMGAVEQTTIMAS